MRDVTARRRPASSGGGPTPAGTRNGFTLIELLLVVVIIGVLVQIALPNFRAVRMKARAVDVMADIDVVTTAVANFQADNHAWPAEAGAGAIPSGLVEYLPDGFSFSGEDFTLDWENFAIPGGLPGDPSTSRILGVGVVTENEQLGNALVDLFGSQTWYTVGDSYVFIVERS